MAFASSTTKYYHEFEGEDGATYQWQIRERGFSGTALPLAASSLDHCETSWKLEGGDEYGPVMGSETSISFFDNSLNDVLGDLTSGTNFDFNRDYALAITRNGSLQWIGYMETPDVIADEEGPTRISLTATDGLGRLKKFAYADTDGNPLSGRARLTTIIAELLGPQSTRENGVEFGSGFYTACQIYPGTTLTSNDDPLYNIYIDRLGLAASRGKNGDLVAATKLDALRMILSTFGLRISYSEGYYHIYNPHLYHGTSSFNRWEYDSSGAQQSATPSSFTHRVTPANETIERTRGTIRQLQQYNGVSVQHSHEVAVVFQQPDFTPASSTGPGERGRSDALKWTRGNLTNVKLVPGDSEEDFAGFVATVEYGGPPLPSTPAEINTQVGTNYWQQESLTTYRTGDSFDAAWEFKVLPNSGGTSGVASNRDPEFMVALQVRLNATNGNTYYLSFDDAAGTAASWGSANAAAWMVYEADTISSKVGGVVSQKFTTDTMPADGTIEIRLGPVIEAAVRSDSGGTTRRATEGILWDNVQFYAVVGDGEYRNDMTITTNFLEGRRDEENIKVITTQLGDGPNDDSRGSMTYSDDISDRTTDWAVGAHAIATGERIDEVVCRTVLKSTNLPRRLHQASYQTIGSILYPQKSINRSGSSYPALSVAIDWRTQAAEGSWYKTSETTFTDDIVTQIESVPRGSTYSGSGTSMLESSTLTRLTKSFFSDQARKIATTTEGIPSGNGTASVAVEEMPEPLLNAGDRIVLIAPDLSFYKLEITQDQPADATELFFADPDSELDPKGNFDFPREVLSGASIYVYEEDLLTLVRAGEQGFAVTVLGGNLGLVNQTTSGSLSQLTVDEWVTTIKTGNTVEIQQTDGSFISVRLTQDAPRGSTTIYFDDPNEIAGTSIALDVTDGDRIAPTGSVGRADFTVTADAITSYISTDGDLIATIDTEASSDTTAYTDTDISTTLKAGDAVYFHRAASGRVFKRTVATVGSPTVNDFTVTSAFGGDDILAVGDYVFGGTLVGMRIDADGVDFVNTHIKSDNYDGTIDSAGAITANGTAGWAITKSGEAEFAHLTVRGTLSSIEGDINLQSTGSIVFAGGGGGSLSPRSLQAGTGELSLGGQSINIGSGLIVASEDSGSITIAGTSTGPVSIGSTSANLSLSTTTSGNISLSPAGTSKVIIDNIPWPDNGVDAPANGEVLAWNSTSGTLEWVAAATGSGTVTQINTGGGLTGGPITTTGTISIDFPTAEVSLFNFRALGIDSEQNYKYLDVSSVGADIVGGANAAAVKTTLSLDQVENEALSTWSGTSNIIYLGTVVTGTWSATNISLAKGGTGTSLSDPNADRILFWDDSASTVTWLSAGDGIAFNGTTLQMDWSAAAGSVTPYKAVVKDGDQNVKTITLGSLATASSVNLSSQVSGSLADAYISSAATWNAKIDTAGTGLSKSSTTLSLNSTIPSVGDWNFTAIGLDNAQNYSGVTITSFASTLLDDTSASVARSTLGLGSLATSSTINNTNWSGADLAIANGGTGASTAANARTNLGLGSGLTTTVQETQINSPGGGDNDQWRERTLTFTNGILTATGSWSAYQEIVAGI